MADPFYWRHARDSLLTTTALRMFQILSCHRGEVFDDVKQRIDEEYRKATGSTGESRHGGIIQTQIQVFREAGWVTLSGTSKGVIEITPAGEQALALLSELPDFLKAAPYFIVELLSRFQLRNPARPEGMRNLDYEAQLNESDIFPYWTLFKVMRSCDDFITTSELRRFVFQIKRHEDILPAIELIKKYRSAIKSGKSDDEINAEFPAELEGTPGETKYLMGRLGIQVGKYPAIVEKDGQSIWRINSYYTKFVDEVIANEPVFKDYLDESTWMRDYGRAVPMDDGIQQKDKPEDPDLDDGEPIAFEIDDTDPVLVEVREIIDAGGSGVLFSGPPGTSKTWYARQVAAKLGDGDPKRVRFVQFHPSLGYDDFVEGYVPVLGAQGTSFEVKSKLLLRLCEKAREVSPALCVLVIDEINRGDTSRIFGELLTYIEASYRDKNFRLGYSGRPFSVPKNLFIIGTFNPFDKSVVELDDAMDRRFERISFDPSPERLNHLLTNNGVNAELVAKAVRYLADINKLSRHGIGHALFLSIRDDATLRHLWRRKLKFILEKAFRFEPELLEKAKHGYLTLFSDPASAGI